MDQQDEKSNIPYIDNIGWCPKCRAETGFSPSGYIQQIWPHHFSISAHGGGAIDSDGVKTIRVLKCQVCRETVTVLETRNVHESRTSGVVVDSKVIFPPAHLDRLDDSVPEIIRALFEEGELCESVGAYRAAGGLYRACVEQICKQQGAKGQNLHARIEALREELRSASYIVEDMHEARALGNDSLHDGLEYGQDEVRDVAELIYEALLVLYIQPEERRRMRAQRLQRRTR